MKAENIKEGMSSIWHCKWHLERHVTISVEWCQQFCSSQGKGISWQKQSLWLHGRKEICSQVSFSEIRFSQNLWSPAVSWKSKSAWFTRCHFKIYISWLKCCGIYAHVQWTAPYNWLLRVWRHQLIFRHYSRRKQYIFTDMTSQNIKVNTLQRNSRVISRSFLKWHHRLRQVWYTET